MSDTFSDDDSEGSHLEQSMDPHHLEHFDDPNMVASPTGTVLAPTAKTQPESSPLSQTPRV